MSTRRQFLKGVGGATLALPVLESIAENKTNKVPMRMVCVGNNFGFAPALFVPKGEGKNYKASSLLKPLEAHRNDLSIFSTLDHPGMGGGHKATHTFLSGVKSSDAKNMREGNISIDQKAAEYVGIKTRYQSMQLSSGADAGSRLSWSSAGVAMPPVQNLQHIYELLFGKISPEVAKKRDYKIGVDTSILDLVKIDAKRLQEIVSKNDQEKLDQYFTSVREVEKGLTMSRGWIHKPKKQVKYTIKAQADSLDLVDRMHLLRRQLGRAPLALQAIDRRLQAVADRVIGGNVAGLLAARQMPALATEFDLAVAAAVPDDGLHRSAADHRLAAGAVPPDSERHASEAQADMTNVIISD